MVCKLSPFVLVLGVLAMVACLAGCKDDDDNVFCFAPPADAEGDWFLVGEEQVTCDGVPEEPDPEWDMSMSIEQGGITVQVTIPDIGTFSGTILGNVLTVSGEFVDIDPVEFTIRMVIDDDDDTATGTIRWVSEGEEETCRGRVEFTGTRGDSI